MIAKVNSIKKWLKTGTINIFGIQYSGKDTVAYPLAELLDAEYISSGEIVRQDRDKLQNSKNNDLGLLAPTKEFSEIMENYLINETPDDKPLVLSSVGRWIGEEQGIIKALEESNHPTKAVLILDISEDEVYKRWQVSQKLNDRGNRIDDSDESKVSRRISEFKSKTIPVIEVYRKMGLAIDINGEQPRDEVLNEVIDKLYEFSHKN